ncbi:hypothetical protein G5714_010620 [Onychostoma macrolepis]|uniref:Uncharacterized protein n=1 Tax=Onychostoma macrolepis TaxID=369639 RepID=A0A7J6CKX9_9TELE|nr:hypothetical protein G5714_010620 [Onychostoma macrolepis]
MTERKIGSIVPLQTALARQVIVQTVVKGPSPSGFSSEQATATDGPGCGKRLSYSSFSPEQTAERLLAASLQNRQRKTTEQAVVRELHTPASLQNRQRQTTEQAVVRDFHTATYLQSRQQIMGQANGKRSTHSGFSPEQAAADNRTDCGEGSSHSGFSPEQTAAVNGTEAASFQNKHQQTMEQTMTGGIETQSPYLSGGCPHVSRWERLGGETGSTLLTSTPGLQEYLPWASDNLGKGGVGFRCNTRSGPDFPSGRTMYPGGVFVVAPPRTAEPPTDH